MSNQAARLTVSNAIPQWVQKLILAGRGFIQNPKNNKTWQAFKAEAFAVGESRFEVVHGGVEYSMTVPASGRISIWKA